jgi:hypothetical protein
MEHRSRPWIRAGVHGDTAIVVKPVAGNDAFVFRATDEDGNQALDTMRVLIYDDIPILTLTSATQDADHGSGFSFATGFSDLGRAVKWEWSVDSGTTYLVRSRGDTAFDPPDPAGTTLTVMARVTDDDGHTATAAAQITVTAWSYLGRSPITGPLVALQGKLYAGVSYGMAMATCDPAVRKWERVPPPPIGIRAVAAGDKILSFSAENYSYPKRMWTYLLDPRVGEWIRGPDIPGDFSLEGASGGSRTFIKTYENLFQYSPSTNTWILGETGPRIGNLAYLAEAGGKLYGASYQLQELDSTTSQWIGLRNLPEFPDWMVGAGNKLYFGASNFGKGSRAVFRYDPVTQELKQVGSSPVRAYAASGVTVMNGKIYMLGAEGELMVYEPAKEP